MLQSPRMMQALAIEAALSARYSPFTSFPSTPTSPSTPTVTLARASGKSNTKQNRTSGFAPSVLSEKSENNVYSSFSFDQDELAFEEEDRERVKLDSSKSSCFASQPSPYSTSLFRSESLLLSLPPSPSFSLSLSQSPSGTLSHSPTPSPSPPHQNRATSSPSQSHSNSQSFSPSSAHTNPSLDPSPTTRHEVHYLESGISPKTLQLPPRSPLTSGIYRAQAGPPGLALGSIITSTSPKGILRTSSYTGNYPEVLGAAITPPILHSPYGVWNSGVQSGSTSPGVRSSGTSPGVRSSNPSPWVRSSSTSPWVGGSYFYEEDSGRRGYSTERERVTDDLKEHELMRDRERIREMEEEERERRAIRERNEIAERIEIKEREEKEEKNSNNEREARKLREEKREREEIIERDERKLRETQRDLSEQIEREGRRQREIDSDRIEGLERRLKSVRDLEFRRETEKPERGEEDIKKIRIEGETLIEREDEMDRLSYYRNEIRIRQSELEKKKIEISERYLQLSNSQYSELSCMRNVPEERNSITKPEEDDLLLSFSLGSKTDSGIKLGSSVSGFPSKFSNSSNLKLNENRISGRYSRDEIRNGSGNESRNEEALTTERQSHSRSGRNKLEDERQGKVEKDKQIKYNLDRKNIEERIKNNLARRGPISHPLENDICQSSNDMQKEQTVVSRGRSSGGRESRSGSGRRRVESNMWEEEGFTADDKMRGSGVNYKRRSDEGYHDRNDRNSEREQREDLMGSGHSRARSTDRGKHIDGSGNQRGSWSRSDRGVVKNNNNLHSGPSIISSFSTSAPSSTTRSASPSISPVTLFHNFNPTTVQHSLHSHPNHIYYSPSLSSSLSNPHPQSTLSVHHNNKQLIRHTSQAPTLPLSTHHSLFKIRNLRTKVQIHNNLIDLRKAKEIEKRKKEISHLQYDLLSRTYCYKDQFIGQLRNDNAKKKVKINNDYEDEYEYKDIYDIKNINRVKIKIDNPYQPWNTIEKTNHIKRLIEISDLNERRTGTPSCMLACVRDLGILVWDHPGVRPNR